MLQKCTIVFFIFYFEMSIYLLKFAVIKFVTGNNLHKK